MKFTPDGEFISTCCISGGGSNNGGSSQAPQQNFAQLPQSLQALMSMNGANGSTQRSPINSGLSNVSALSQLFGYQPGSIFGYNMGNQSGAAPNQNDLLSSLMNMFGSNNG